MVTNRYLGAIILLALTGALGCSGEGSNHDAVRVEDLNYRLLPGGARILSGTLVNEGPDHLDVAQIEVSLFDKDNRRISSMHVVIQDVEAGDSKSFREPVDVKLNVRGARVRGIVIP